MPGFGYDHKNDYTGKEFGFLFTFKDSEDKRFEQNHKFKVTKMIEPPKRQPASKK